jgi:hypothetical protein
LYITSFVEGTLFVFFNIAEVAALPRVVVKAQLPAATAQNEAAFGIAGMLGPGLGTFLYQNLSRGLPYVVDSVSFAVSVVTLFFIRAEFQTERSQASRNLRGEIRQGLAWLWRQPLIRFMAVLTGGINFVHAAAL